MTLAYELPTRLTNANGSTLPIGTPVYASAAGSVNNAKADAAATALCIGLVADAGGIATTKSGLIRSFGSIIATTSQWDTITGGSGGLTYGAKYYLSSATAGKLTTAPGTIPMAIGKAVSTTELLLNIHAPSIFQTEISGVDTNATPNHYTNLIPYIPLTPGGTIPATPDNVIGGFISKHKGNVELIVAYAMSSSNSGNVDLTFSHAALGTGGDPTAALSAETHFTLTPGSNTTVHTLDSSVAGVLSIAVSPGDYVVVKLERTIGGSDTHTGDFRILGMMARAV